MMKAHVLTLSNFEMSFVIECNESQVGIGVVINQEGRLVEYFSEKLFDAKWRCSTYDLLFYALVRIVQHWEDYLAYREFVVYLDHQEWEFELKKKIKGCLPSGLPVATSVEVIGLEELRNQYKSDPHFGTIISNWKGQINMSNCLIDYMMDIYLEAIACVFVKVLYENKFWGNIMEIVWEGTLEEARPWN